MRGPRFETKAEFDHTAWATSSHDPPTSDLCVEAGLRYNSLALVDNCANGLECTEIDFAGSRTC